MYVLIYGCIYISYEVLDNYVVVVVNGLIECICFVDEFLVGIEVCDLGGVILVFGFIDV